MGNWNISIRGVGSHHNGLKADAEQMAAKLVDDLRAAGHNVVSAEVTYGGVVVLHDGQYGGEKPQPRSLMALAVLALVLLPGIALAQIAPTVGPQPSLGQTLLDMLLSPSGIAMLVGAVGSVLGLVLGADVVRRRRVALAAYHAFHIVEDLASETDNKVDDKVAEGLKALDAYLVANGWRPLKPGETEVAKLTFTSLNGSSKLAEKVTAAAIEAAKPEAPVPPVP